MVYWTLHLQRALMRTKPSVSHYQGIKGKPRLALDLQQKIKLHIQQNSSSFISQILQQKRSLSTAASQALRMDEQDNQATAKCTKEKHETLITDCSSEGKRLSVSDQEDVNNSHSAQRSKKKKRQKNSSTSSAGDAEPPKRKQPTHFVAVQITDQQIHSVGERIQEEILKASEVDISTTRILPIKFHLTLMVMHLEDDDAVRRAGEALAKVVPSVADRLEGRDIVLEFKGLSVFGGGRVVFSPPQQSQGLEDLHVVAEEVQAQMKETGIISTDGEDKKLEPHLTLFKINFRDSKELIKKGIKRLEERLYAPFKEEHFGFQRVSSLQLCQMSKPRREDGYYLVTKEVPLKTT